VRDGPARLYLLPLRMTAWPTAEMSAAGRQVRSLGLSRRAGYIVGTTRLTQAV
jgi:hypothetical protein